MDIPKTGKITFSCLSVSKVEIVKWLNMCLRTIFQNSPDPSTKEGINKQVILLEHLIA